jgi:hypothetical protein
MGDGRVDFFLGRLSSSSVFFDFEGVTSSSSPKTRRLERRRACDGKRNERDEGFNMTARE